MQLWGKRPWAGDGSAEPQAALGEEGGRPVVTAGYMQGVVTGTLGPEAGWLRREGVALAPRRSGEASRTGRQPSGWAPWKLRSWGEALSFLRASPDGRAVSWGQQESYRGSATGAPWGSPVLLSCGTSWSHTCVHTTHAVTVLRCCLDSRRPRSPGSCSSPTLGLH